MKLIAMVTVVLLAIPFSANATDRYVDSTTSGCSAPSDTDFNPATETCGSGSELVYNSITAAVTAHASGDNIYVLAGTYASAFDNTLKSGVNSSQPTKLWAYNGQTVTIQTPVGATNGDAFRITSKNDISIKQLIVDNTNVVAPNGKRGFAFRIDGTISVPSNRITLDGVTGRNAGIGMFTAHVHFLHVTRSRFHNNGHDAFDHGIYTDNGTDDAIIEYSEFDHNAQMGAQLYKQPSRMQFRNNYVHDNCVITLSGSEIFLSYLDNVIERNMVVSSGNCTTAITVNLQTPTRSIVRHNAFYCKTGGCTNGINIPSSSTVDTVVQNNIALGFTNNVRNLGTNTTLTDNLTTGTASAIWVSPSTGDLRLKAGSVAIDGGTAIGGAANGLPDQGAFEVPTFSTCSVEAGATSVVRVTFINNLKPPMLPASSATGVTFRKNGSNNAVISSMRPTDNTYEFTVTNSYVGGDTVDISIVPASTNLTDSALLGNTYNQQFLSTITNTACTNNAAGAPAHTFTQARYELHDWRGLEASPTMLPHGFASTGAAENFASYKLPAGGKIRVRFAVVCGGANCPISAFHPYFSTGGAYAPITDDFSVNNIKMCGVQSGSDVPANGSATTNQLSTAGTFVAGGVVFTANDVPAIVGLNNGFKTELEYCFESDTDSTGYFDLRLHLDSGTAFTVGGGAYTVIPRLVNEPRAAGGP